MCGIIGLYKNKYQNSDSKFFKKSIEFLMRETEIRGNDTSGLQIKNSAINKKYLFKRNFESSRLVRDAEYKSFVTDALQSGGGFVSVLGHCRMQTNGDYTLEQNNQPTIKNDTVCVHNGIIANIDELWNTFPQFNKQYDIDTEIICDFFNEETNEPLVYSDVLNNIFKSIYGETTFGIMPGRYNDLVFATNTGSAYYISDEQNNLFVFASEQLILEKYKAKFRKLVGQAQITQLLPNEAIIINENTGEICVSKMDNIGVIANMANKPFEILINSKLYPKKNVRKHTEYSNEERALLQYDKKKLRELKRCTKCLLPETFPFIEFDEQGVCNYCHNYEKIEVHPEQELEKIVKEVKNSSSGKFLLTFSGGRDSCYGMHVLKQMDTNFLSYTYDWGMVTDLARRNQSRLCGKLGVEHIIVSADIDKKRKNIRKNVNAWLKRPSLGLVPLFMAGDKHYFYYANKVGKDNGLDDLIVLCDNPLEVTYFKFGFAGAKPNFVKNGQLFTLAILDNLKMIFFYLKEFIMNPRLINSSIFDTIKGYLSYYTTSHNYINLFKYIRWDEDQIEKTLLEEYDWEIAEDTATTWRIGDATAPFYNYIYTTVAGFSENDTFRSNQIREGVLTREQALELTMRDNKPRYESIKWYLDTIGLDFSYVIEKINNIPKLY